MCHLTRDSRRKNSEVIDALLKEGIEITSQDFSRRLKTINEHFIKGYRMFIEPEAFDLWSNVLVTAEVTKEASEELRARMHQNAFPFRSTMKLSDDFLLWFIRLPPGHVTELINYLHRITNNMDVNLADYKRSEVYCLWDEAFDEEQHQWRSDKKFLTNGVIS